jgi:hypothetical protein
MRTALNSNLRAYKFLQRPVRSVKTAIPMAYSAGNLYPHGLKGLSPGTYKLLRYRWAIQYMMRKQHAAALPATQQIQVSKVNSEHGC